MVLWLLPVNSYFLSQLSALLDDKPGAMGLPVPEGDYLVHIANNLQVSPQKYIMLEIALPLLPPPLLHL